MEYGGEHRWPARDRVVTARIVQYLDRSESMEVDIAELGYCLLGPEDSVVDINEKISGEEMELLERKRISEEWLKEGRNAEVEEGRAKVTAGGGVTRHAVARSRCSEAEVERLLADVNGPGYGRHSCVGGSGVTREGNT